MSLVTLAVNLNIFMNLQETGPVRIFLISLRSGQEASRQQETKTKKRHGLRQDQPGN
jgi:hypothetical protein